MSAYGLPAHHIIKCPHGVWMPRLIYGTAWKKDQTTRLVELALDNGFRGIDTACQPKHYQEELVGKAIQNQLQSGKLKREDLFIQTKFTSLNGQDPNRVPYDKKAPLDEQVQQSIQKSLHNLGLSYIDSLVLHGPLRSHTDNMKVWRQFENAVDKKEVRQIGVSNFYDLSALKSLYEEARIKPAVVQNRFYQQTNWDKELRAWCSLNGVVYQSFWTLTANPQYMKQAEVMKAAEKLKVTPAQVFFRFVMNLGICPLTGTTDPKHMKEDLAVLDLELHADDLEAIRKLADL
ncbi:methylglyoxal reductase DkgA-like [Convolutriloba macropyga]|uniref:methylglyoxal reductase DkgA-like n=1 Tax=Convolutriloba macropyga TaxID=536237 RepID=UPI003F51B831